MSSDCSPRVSSDQNHTTVACALTLASFPSLLSLSSFLSAAAERREAQQSGAAAGPLAGELARPRLSTPPSSGLGDGALDSAWLHSPNPNPSYSSPHTIDAAPEVDAGGGDAAVVPFAGAHVRLELRVAPSSGTAVVLLVPTDAVVRARPKP